MKLLVLLGLFILSTIRRLLDNVLSGLLFNEFNGMKFLNFLF